MKYYELKRTLALLSIDNQYQNIKNTCHNIGASIDDISQVGVTKDNTIIVSFKPKLPKYIQIKLIKEETR